MRITHGGSSIATPASQRTTHDLSQWLNGISRTNKGMISVCMRFEGQEHTWILVYKQCTDAYNVLKIKMWLAVGPGLVVEDPIHTEVIEYSKLWVEFVLVVLPFCCLVHALCNSREQDLHSS